MIKFPKSLVLEDWVGQENISNTAPYCTKIEKKGVLFFVNVGNSSLSISYKDTKNKFTGIYSHLKLYKLQIVPLNNSALKKTIFLDPFGKVAEYIHTKNGVNDGPYMLKGSIKGHYKKGQKDGLWKFYYNKRLLEVCRYKRGYLTGNCTYYWMNGHKRCRLHLIKGRAHGWANYWNKKGELIAKVQFKNGRQILRKIEKLNQYGEPIKHLRISKAIVDTARTKYCKINTLKLKNKLIEIENAYTNPYTSSFVFNTF